MPTTELTLPVVRESTYIVVWEFQVKAECEAEFVAAYGPDGEWILNDESPLPPAFLDKFGPGGLLTILNGRGGKVLDVDLSGAGKAREIMRGVCRM